MSSTTCKGPEIGSLYALASLFVRSTLTNISIVKHANDVHSCIVFSNITRSFYFECRQKTTTLQPQTNSCCMYVLSHPALLVTGSVQIDPSA